MVSRISEASTVGIESILVSHLWHLQDVFKCSTGNRPKKRCWWHPINAGKIHADTHLDPPFGCQISDSWRIQAHTLSDIMRPPYFSLTEAKHQQFCAAKGFGPCNGSVILATTSCVAWQSTFPNGTLEGSVFFFFVSACFTWWIVKHHDKIQRKTSTNLEGKEDDSNLLLKKFMIDIQGILVKSSISIWFGWWSIMLFFQKLTPRVRCRRCRHVLPWPLLNAKDTVIRSLVVLRQTKEGKIFPRSPLNWWSDKCVWIVSSVSFGILCFFGVTLSYVALMWRIYIYIYL